VGQASAVHRTGCRLPNKELPVLPSRTPFGPAPWRARPAGANGRRAAGACGTNGGGLGQGGPVQAGQGRSSGAEVRPTPNKAASQVEGVEPGA